MVSNINLSEFVLENSDIITTISKYTHLVKRGNGYWACCPFHHEKTPSFAINEEMQVYHCFGCHTAGNAITFIKKIENVEFPEAVRILADINGFKLPEVKMDEHILNKKKKVDRTYNLLKDAARYYYNNLKLPEAELARDYLEKRKIDKETVIMFGIGYSLGFDQIIKHLRSKGYTLDEMIEAGVVGKSEHNRCYDFFGKRLIFPIINIHGNVVGFSGRDIEGNSPAKYKNSPQNIVFDKSRCVYGINLAKKFKQTENFNEVILVEGQIDVISLHKAGVKNALACLGTALTPYHLRDIKRLADKVVLCFDGDKAGINATLRSIDVLISKGFAVYVASIPDGADPDEFVNEYGKDKFYEIINQAKYWVEYLILKYANDYDLSKLEEKNKYINKCLEFIKTLPTESEKDIYINLIHKITNVPKQAIKEDAQIINNFNIDKKREYTSIISNKDNAYVKAIRFILNALLNNKDYAYLSSDIKENILNNDYIKIYEYVEECHKNGTKPIISTVYSMFEVESQEDIYGIINFEIDENQDNESQYKDCIKILIKSGLSMRQNILTEKLKTVTNENEKREIKLEIANIINKINSFKK